MTDTLIRRLGAAVAGVLATDAMIHLYWVTGATWPARDERALSFAVLNLDVPFTPRVLLPLVALLLTAATVVVLGSRAGDLPDWLARLAHAGTIIVALGIAARGAAGLGWATGLGVDTPGSFLWLNRLLYTPLCIALFAATWTVVRHGGKSRGRSHVATHGR
jgi:hypothetical protein